MKNRIRLSLLFALLLCLLLGSAAYAEGTDAAQLNFVTDAAGLLTESELSSLEAKAQSLADDYQCGVYIVAVQDYTDYVDGDVTDCAKGIYTEYGLGYGGERDGVLLLLSMADRDYAIIAYGNFGNAAFTDYGKEVLSGKFLDDFGDDRWADGFAAYLDQCGAMIAAARDGAPLDVDSDISDEPMSPVLKLLLIIVVPCVIALIVCGIFAAQMKTARKQTAAADYIVPGSENLRIREDVFTYRTETREVIESKSSSGGTSVGSDGFSSHSGKF